MPAFVWNGNLLYYAAMKDHLSLFPGSTSVIKKFTAELKPFDASSKGTIRFTADKPLPITLVKKIARAHGREPRAPNASAYNTASENRWSCATGSLPTGHTNICWSPALR